MDAGSGKIGTPEEFQCSGTLIDEKWVLTAKHCITDSFATTDNSGVLVGDRRVGEGEPHTLESIRQDPDTDSALLELEDPVSNSSFVIGFEGSDAPAEDENVAIRGWGSTPAPDLQVATMRTSDSEWDGAEEGNRLLFANLGSGVLELGDSGAGVYYGGLVTGVISTTDDVFGEASAVPTADIADWILRESGVEAVNSGSTASFEPIG